MKNCYVYPQENGNRTDIRWVALTNLHGIGIFASCVNNNQLLNFSAHQFTDKDLEKATHIDELELRDQIYLNLDYKHLGLGSVSCGPARLQKYKLEPEEFNFSLWFKSFSKNIYSR